MRAGASDASRPHSQKRGAEEKGEGRESRQRKEGRREGEGRKIVEKEERRKTGGCKGEKRREK